MPTDTIFRTKPCKYCGNKFRPRSERQEYCNAKCSRLGGDKRNKQPGKEERVVITGALSERLIRAFELSGLTRVEVCQQMHVEKRTVDALLKGPDVLEGHNIELLTIFCEVVGCSITWLTTGEPSQRAARMIDLFLDARMGDGKATEELLQLLEVSP